MPVHNHCTFLLRCTPVYAEFADHYFQTYRSPAIAIHWFGFVEASIDLCTIHAGQLSCCTHAVVQHVRNHGERKSGKSRTQAVILRSSAKAHGTAGVITCSRLWQRGRPSSVSKLILGCSIKLLAPLEVFSLLCVLASQALSRSLVSLN